MRGRDGAFKSSPPPSPKPAKKAPWSRTSLLWRFTLLPTKWGFQCRHIKLDKAGLWAILRLIEGTWPGFCLREVGLSLPSWEAF